MSKQILPVVTFSNLLFLINIHGGVFQDINVCQDIFILLKTENKSAKIVDVEQDASVKLFCRFCSTEVSHEPKVWYYKNREPWYPKEELTGRHLCNKNMTITSDHVLRIKHFNSSAHSGIYICEDPKSNPQTKTVFTYVLEGVYASSVLPYTGTLEEWIQYKEGIIDPINEQFKKPKQEPFVMFNKIYSFSFRIKTHWEPWSKCIFNGQEGQCTKKGKCYLKIVPNSKDLLQNVSSFQINYINRYFITNSYDVPCRSIILHEKLPDMSRFVRFIPDYEAKDHCIMERKISPNPTLDSEYKYSTIVQIPEGGHGILACSESLLKSKVYWFKDGKLLNSSFRYNIAKNEEEPPLTIDSFNSIYILHASKKEEGNYSCIVDERKIYKYDVRVVTKSGLLNDDFFRYSLYLSFVLLLTTTCYCAGICVAWHERASFSDPLNLNTKKKQYQHLQTVDLEQ